MFHVSIYMVWLCSVCLVLSCVMQCFIADKRRKSVQYVASHLLAGVSLQAHYCSMNICVLISQCMEEVMPWETKHCRDPEQNQPLT